MKAPYRTDSRLVGVRLLPKGHDDRVTVLGISHHDPLLLWIQWDDGTISQAYCDDMTQEEDEMYTSKNFQTKKELKAAVAAGQRVTLYAPGLGTPVTDGIDYVSGPQYPQAHRWYAKVTMKGGVVVKVQ